MINKLTTFPEFLLSRYKKWKSNSYLDNVKQFRKIATEGQSPTTMIISCCDSRIHPTSIFEAVEGEFFIHRNIANLVPPYSPDIENHGTSAAIEYAIKVLKIQHLIILGHKDCGGIKSGHTMHASAPNPDYVFINKWLSILLPAFNKIQKNISEQNQINQLEKESIKANHSLSSDQISWFFAGSALNYIKSK